MADFPLTEVTQWVQSTGATITAGATAHVKGAWAEHWASTPFEFQGLYLDVLPNTNVNYLLDIGIGPAASEVVIISNMYFCRAHVRSRMFFPIPIIIPKGSRVVARCQSSTANVTFYAVMYGYALGFKSAQSLSRCLTLGDDPSLSRGTLIDPGAVANTKGAWVPFSTSISFPVSHVIVSLGNNLNNVMSNCSWWLDIGIGAAGSEKVVVPDLYFLGATTENLFPDVFSIPVSLPKGERLSMRASCTITNTIDRLFRATLHLLS